MPKFDWFNDDADDQPRWEPRFRVARERRLHGRDRRSQLEAAMALVMPSLPNQPARRPLHLIWGEPRPDQDAGA